MRRPGDRSPLEGDLWVQHAVLLQVITLHPDHLTSEELVVRVEEEPSGTDRAVVLDSLQALKRSGLVRFNGEVVEPTYAALCADAIFALS